MNPSDKIYIAGHEGLVGSALYRRLKAAGYTNLLVRTHGALDLTRQRAVEDFFMAQRPDYVLIAAAKVGGILANSQFPADFIYENLAIEANLIHSAWQNGVKRLLFLASSCIYPRECPQPIKEEYLLTAPLEPTNEPYAVAKIAGIKLCQSYNRQHGTQFYSVMPTNMYGPHDNFDLETSHVLPALIRKFHTAKQAADQNRHPSPVTVWGTGTPRREFLHVDDMADACVFLMNLEEKAFRELAIGDGLPLVNVGTGQDLTIGELADLIKGVVGFEGEKIFDATHPDGTPQKLLDVSKLAQLGWTASISLKEGIENTYQWCLKNDIFSP